MICQDVLRNKLHQELVDAGIDASNMTVSSINNTAIGAKIEFFGSVDMGLVQSVIDEHDPTPLPPMPTIEDQIMANTDYLLDVDFRLILVELGMI